MRAVEGIFPFHNDRCVMNGILWWVLCTGAAWADLPERFPSSSVCYQRFRNLVKIGVFRKNLEEREAINLSECFIDGTFVVAKKGCKRGKGQAGQRYEATVIADASGSSTDSVPFDSASAAQGIEMIAPHRRNRKRKTPQMVAPCGGIADVGKLNTFSSGSIPSSGQWHAGAASTNVLPRLVISLFPWFYSEGSSGSYEMTSSPIVKSIRNCAATQESLPLWYFCLLKHTSSYRNSGRSHFNMHTY